MDQGPPSAVQRPVRGRGGGQGQLPPGGPVRDDGARVPGPRAQREPAARSAEVKAPPEAACGRSPLKGAPPAARQSRFRGGR
ncbi:hypothetical protein EZ242_17945 [Ramlibacter rhizophilus]|uniref:Uncharacterized protein n=1 Tax=Ramlibacter rhizophilus TaxID=1781167 RepID=A0A4Z0BHM3_9BURK|nr:hypothetical protein EZ242_17945 [Ramlibacter rhizophilus]